MFAGTFTGVGGSRNTAAGFYGWGKSTPVFINCLENGTYNNVSGYNPYMYEGTDKDNTETTANSYYKHGNINLEGISDASAMTDGEIVSNLGDAWVIDGILNMPMPLSHRRNSVLIRSSGWMMHRKRKKLYQIKNMSC